MSPGSNTSERLQQKEDPTLPGATGKDGLPNMEVVPGTEINFTVIPTKKYPENATPAEVTRYNMDHSYVLRTLIENTYANVSAEPNMDGDTPKPQLMILGELQFAFICFLIGQNYDGFEQWKKLVHLLCSCEEAISVYPELYSNFITVLHRQLTEVPEDFFVDIVTADNFLTRTLQRFFSTLEDLESSTGDVIALRQRGLRFRAHLQKKFDWDFTEEPDDYAPVLVT